MREIYIVEHVTEIGDEDWPMPMEAYSDEAVAKRRVAGLNAGGMTGHQPPAHDEFGRHQWYQVTSLMLDEA
jgi:hypothetical protein